MIVEVMWMTLGAMLAFIVIRTVQIVVLRRE